MIGKNYLITTNRLENFSDGVFTIVLTLLAFQFKVPKFHEDAGLHENFKELLTISPYLLGFIFSFVFVAVFWVNHHHLYRTIKEADSKLIWFNIHSLFWITMMPFAIAMVGDHPHVPLTAICLGIVLFMASLTAYVLIRYSYTKSKLVDKDLSHESIRRSLRRSLLCIIITSAGIITALFAVYISYIIYFAVLIIFTLPQRLEKMSRSRQEKGFN